MFQASRLGKDGRVAGKTLLMLAALDRSNEAVDILLKAGADLNKVSSDGHTALLHALESKDLTIIEKVCGCTTVNREWAFSLIGLKSVTISGPIVKFIKDSLNKGRRHIVLNSTCHHCISRKELLNDFDF